MTRKSAGRPSKYEPRYCDEVVKAMAEGRSLTAFAGMIGVHRQTLYEWANQHPEFSDAVKKGKAACALWWEERLKKIAIQGGGSGSATAVIFGLKNMAPDEWADTQRQEVSGPGGKPVEVNTQALREKLESRIARIAPAKGEKQDPSDADGG